VIHRIYTPKTGWIEVDDSEPIINKAPYIGGCPMTERSVRDCRHVFTPTDRRMQRNRTVKDVDKALDRFQVRYPHLKRPDRMRKDPFPEVKITDDKRCQKE